MSIKLTVNKTEHYLESPPDTPLLWALRDELKLTGTKYGCGIAQCGACTVKLDDLAVRSCQVAIGDIEGSEVVTIEAVEGEEAECGGERAGVGVSQDRETWRRQTTEKLATASRAESDRRRPSCSATKRFEARASKLAFPFIYAAVAVTCLCSPCSTLKT